VGGGGELSRTRTEMRHDQCNATQHTHSNPHSNLAQPHLLISRLMAVHAIACGFVWGVHGLVG